MYNYLVDSGTYSNLSPTQEATISNELLVFEAENYLMSQSALSQIITESLDSAEMIIESFEIFSMATESMAFSTEADKITGETLWERFKAAMVMAVQKIGNAFLALITRIKAWISKIAVGQVRKYMDENGAGATDENLEKPIQIYEFFMTGSAFTNANIKAYSGGSSNAPAFGPGPAAKVGKAVKTAVKTAGKAVAKTAGKAAKVVAPRQSAAKASASAGGAGAPGYADTLRQALTNAGAKMQGMAMTEILNAIITIQQNSLNDGREYIKKLQVNMDYIGASQQKANAKAADAAAAGIPAPNKPAPGPVAQANTAASAAASAGIVKYQQANRDIIASIRPMSKNIGAYKMVGENLPVPSDGTRVITLSTVLQVRDAINTALKGVDTISSMMSLPKTAMMSARAFATEIRNIAGTHANAATNKKMTKHIQFYGKFCMNLASGAIQLLNAGFVAAVKNIMTLFKVFKKYA